MLGIVGPSGSGKTFLQNRLLEAFPGTSCLPTDNYYFGEAHNQECGMKTFDEPGAVNLRLTGFHCELLKLGQPFVFIPSYGYDKVIVHNVWQRVPASPLIIVEGLFILEKEVRRHLDYIVFLDVSTHSALWRRIARDSKRTSQTSHEVAQMFINEVYPEFARYVLPKRHLADMFVQNDAFSRDTIRSMASVQAQSKILLNPGRKICVANQEAKIVHFVLPSLGFSASANYMQRDVFFVPSPDLLGKSSGSSKADFQDIIRFRSEALVGSDEERHTLSYRFHRRGQQQAAYTFPVSVDIEAGLKTVGYAVFFSIIKNRWLFEDGERNEIAFDTIVAHEGIDMEKDLSGLLYAEIRSNDEGKLEEIKRCFCQFGFRDCDFFSTSYVDLAYAG